MAGSMEDKRSHLPYWVGGSLQTKCFVSGNAEEFITRKQNDTLANKHIAQIALLI